MGAGMATATEIQTAQRTAINEAVSAAAAFLSGLEALAGVGVNGELAAILPDLQYTQYANINSALNLLTMYRPSPLNIPTIAVGAPAAPDLSFTPVQDFAVPDFDGSAPGVSIPAAPTIALPSVPAAPAIDDVALPAAPTIALPAAPEVGSITLPSAPSISIPEFTAGLPDEDFLVPSNTFSFNEQAYSSTLLDAVKAKLLSDVQNGGYGIETADEVDLWNRERDREYETAQTAIDDIYRNAGARGFPMPPNDLAVALERAHQGLQNKLSTVSRDIALRRSELYVENRKFTLQESRQIETMLIQYHNSVQERALNAAKAALDAAVTIYEAQLKRYNARLDAYKTEASVFESKIRAALSQVELYRIQITSKQVEAEIQKQQVDVYRAQLAGVEQVVNIYRAQMEAANVQANVQRQKIESFRALIDAYVAQVQAGTARVQLFDAQIKGEIAKVQVYESQVRAYNATIEGTKTRADIAIGRARAEADKANAELAKYRGQLEGSELSLKSQIAQLEATTRLYQADISAYSATSSAVGEAYRLMQQAQRDELEGLLKTAQLKIENAKTILDADKTVLQTRVTANQIGVDFYKNWVAGLTSALIGIASTS